MDTIAIIGASLAGVRAAETLRAEGFEGRVVLVGDEPHAPYDRPPLSKGVLTGVQAMDSSRLRPDNFYEAHDIDLMVGRRVDALRPGQGAIEFADGSTLRVDKVLLATGGRPRRLAVPGADLSGVHTLRTLDDALAIAADLEQAERVVVIGAGFIGAEVAASSRQLGKEVIMLEAAPRALGRGLRPEISDWLIAEHRRRGVETLTSTVVTRLDGSERVRGVVTGDGLTFPADLVIVGVGIVPNVELAEMIGLHVDNGIVVDELCRTSNESIFAAGDVTNHPSPYHGRRVRHEHWQNAGDQGAAAARSMMGNGTPHGTTAPWFWSDQYEINIQMAGEPADTDEVVWRGDVEGRSFTAFYVRAGVLSGVVAVNRPKDVRGAMALIDAGMPIGADLLSDPSVDLRKTALRAGSP